MTKQEILDRIQNVLNQNIFNQSQDLDLLRHDLENEIIELDDVNEKLKEENEFLQKDSLSMFNYTKELLQKIKELNETK